MSVANNEERPFTQPDPIGLAGGLNLYGYAGGDPVNGSDPFGLKVCFKGSAKSVQRQKDATQKATETTFDLDDDNCAKNVVDVGPQTERFLAFRKLVEADFTLVVRFSLLRPTGSRQVSGNLATGDLVLFLDINRFASRFGTYYTHDSRGNCERNSRTRNSDESLVAHELSHPYNQLIDNTNPDAAMRWQNQIHLTQGRPIRYNCGDH